MTLQTDLGDFHEFGSLQEEIIDFSSRGIRPGLRRISRLLSLLGNPQLKTPAIQILGTNGKGSSAATMEAILRGGLRTALYTSPHLISLQERLRMDGRYFPIDVWRSAWGRIMDAVTGDTGLSADKPSFFEHFTALCMLMTHEAEADITILEAGMGGRYDATSVCEPMAVMINPIGMDHMQYLGSTLEEIAGEKFAAVKAGADAFYAGDDATLTPLFSRRCERTGAIPFLLDDMARPVDIKCTLDRTNFSYSAAAEIGGVREINGLATPLLGLHQASNVTRVITVLLSLREKFDMFSFISPDTIQKTLMRTDWPGRLEIFRTAEGPRVILDGAHNEHAMKMLTASLNSITDGEGKIEIASIVLAVMSDKDIPSLLGALSALKRPVYCAGLPMERAARAEELAGMCDEIGMDVAGFFSDPSEALKAAVGQAERHELVLCCGSLYLVGYIRRMLKYNQ